MVFCLFLHKYLKGRGTDVRDGEKERESEILHMLVHSKVAAITEQDQAQTSNQDPLHGLECGYTGPITWSSSAALPDPLAVS